MTVDETYDVQAVLALGDLPPEITFETPTTVVVLKARCEVEAELTGADFAITPAGPQAQSFMDQPHLVWQWDVRPEHPGDALELHLRLQATRFEGGRSLPGGVVLNESLIDVRTVDRSAWKRFDDWSSDVFGHPVVAALILPTAGWILVAARRWLPSQSSGTDKGSSGASKPH
jgi:hypothetical protein